VRVALYGSRSDGHARVVLELFGRDPRFEVVGLLDDLPQNANRRIGDLVVLGGAGELPGLTEELGLEGVLLGFGAAHGRERVLAAVEAAGLTLPILVHESAWVSSSSRLSPGVQLLPGARVNPGSSLGRGVLVNTGAIVEHDVKVGDFSVIDPGAVLTGRVRVGPSVEIGSGAVLIPDVEVGGEATIGAGAVVTKNVPAGETVVGVPARPQRSG